MRPPPVLNWLFLPLLLASLTQAQVTWTESVWQTFSQLLGSEGQGSEVNSQGSGVSDDGMQEVTTVDVLWGVPDTEATVGKMFRMSLPANAFTGAVHNYTPESSVTESVEVSPSVEVTDIMTSSDLPNRIPQLINPIRKLVCRLGTYFSLVVPEDTFYDFEDGNTRRLSLRLTTLTGLMVPTHSFIQLNAQTQVLYGLALSRHLQVEPYIVSLVATDHHGDEVIDHIEVIIDTTSVNDVSFVIGAEFSMNYTAFTSRTVNIITLLHRVATFYGDASPQFYTVTALEQGSVQLGWTDNRISKVTCQNDSIQERYGVIYSGDRINPAFTQTLMPEFPLTNLRLDQMGVCAATLVTTVESTTEPAAGAVVAGTNLVLVTVLPILLLLILVAIAVLIYCCCIRERNKNVNYLTDDERLIYAKHRSPVLMEAEMELNDVPKKPRRPLVLDSDLPPKVFDNPGYLDTGDDRKAPPPYSLPDDEDIVSPMYTPKQTTSTPRLYFPDDTDGYNDRPPPPAYRLPPLYTPGSSDI